MGAPVFLLIKLLYQFVVYWLTHINLLDIIHFIITTFHTNTHTHITSYITPICILILWPEESQQFDIFHVFNFTCSAYSNNSSFQVTNRIVELNMFWQIIFYRQHRKFHVHSVLVQIALEVVIKISTASYKREMCCVITRNRMMHVYTIISAQHITPIYTNKHSPLLVMLEI